MSQTMTPTTPLVAAPLSLLATEAYARRRAVEQLAPAELADPAVIYALRRLLASDRDVATRALAAGALGSVRTAPLDPVPWLVDALADVSPVVRDAAIRALARHAAPAAYPRLCRLARTDTTWWVRRAALYAIGVLGTTPAADPIAPARAALTDPFWRVRHAAVQVLTIHGNRAPERRAEILADIEGGTADYLRSLWGPALLDDAPRDRVPSRLPAELLDRDPAVVTARLADMEAPPAMAIVELLCDPHVPLRTLAAARLIAAADADAFAAALHWLDEPRIPHVAATVITMLDSLGEAALALATRVLSAPARPGASRWAIGWVVATRYLDLAPLAWARAVELGEPALAMSLAPTSALVDGLRAPAPLDTALAAADELTHRPAHVRSEVLAAIPPHTASAVQMRLVSALHGLDATAHTAHLAAARDGADPLARATALALVAATEGSEARRAALADVDPAVREAVVAHATLAELSALLAGERDPWVRRAIARTVARTLRAGRRDAITPRTNDVDTTALVEALARDADERIRTLAVPLLDGDQPAHVACIVALARDPSLMVQSAIVERLSALTDAQLARATVLEAGSASEGGHPVGLAAWVGAAASEPPRLEIAITDDGDAAHAAITDDARGDAPAARARIDLLRPFGTSGVVTSPLVISGAFDLQPGSLRVAAERGVTTYFWEPAYAGLTRFLRGKRERVRSQVVTGTYHADERSIVKDVDRALRRLRRDTLDVFLLFWSRSDARLDEASVAVMDALKRAGKVRAIGFSTHDRALATRALDRAPWDVVMTRHSAAHPGIEDGFLAHARARGAGVLTFTALCYGRMLQGEGAPSAQDCYRYSLAQDGVTATISAPRRHRELVENLAVLDAGPLAEADVARVRAFGAGVRVESQRFNALIRQPTRDAAAAAMAMLEQALAPEQGDRDEACVTPEALQRSLGSRGRGRASLPSAMLRRGRL